MAIAVQRIYAREYAASEADFRVLVDRLWPRGVSKERAHLDLWLKDAAPSADLRKWFGHRWDRWETFKSRYIRELELKDDFLFEPVVEHAERGSVLLLYAAKDTRRNHAHILKAYLDEHFG